MKRIVMSHRPSNKDKSTGIDRRCHYRIEDHLYFRFLTVEPGTVRIQQAHQHFEPSKGGELLSEMKQLDEEAQNLLRDIAQQHRSVAIYLSIINKKFDLVAQHLIDTGVQTEQELQKVNLSEGGMSFCSSGPVDVGSHLALHLHFVEQSEDVFVYGKVIRCLQSKPTSYHTAIQFIQLPAYEQKLITRRVLKVQMQSHRAQ